MARAKSLKDIKNVNLIFIKTILPLSISRFLHLFASFLNKKKTKPAKIQEQKIDFYHFFCYFSKYY